MNINNIIVTPEMLAAGAKAAHDYMTETGGNDPSVIYKAMHLVAQQGTTEDAVYQAIERLGDVLVGALGTRHPAINDFALLAFAARDGAQLSAKAEQYDTLLDWAVSSWRAEVSQRPLINANRRSLDDAWRQVILFAGGDADALVGPSHDSLVAAAQRDTTTEPLTYDQRTAAERLVRSVESYLFSAAAAGHIAALHQGFLDCRAAGLMAAEPSKEGGAA